MDNIATDDDKELFISLVKNPRVDRGAKLKVISNNQLS